MFSFEGGFGDGFDAVGCGFPFSVPGFDVVGFDASGSGVTFTEIGAAFVHVSDCSEQLTVERFVGEEDFHRHGA